jgi:hypothetical protein
MTNEDVIDLYNRIRLGTPVVVLARGRFTFSRATGTRATGFAAPISRNISAAPFRPAASA